MNEATKIEINAPALMQAAETAAITAHKAASPHPGMIPSATLGSAADAAATLIAAGMGARVAELSAKLAVKGRLIQTATQNGIAHLQDQDEHNAQELHEFAQSGKTEWV